MLLASRVNNPVSEALIILFLLALPFLFFWMQVTPNPADRATFGRGDFNGQYYPLHAFATRELAAGHLPLWDPYIYGGQPALADIQSGVFYPPNLLTIPLLAGGDYSLFVLEMQVIAHFSLASLFTYLFMRRVTGNRFAAVVSALTFTYGGYLTSYPVQQVTMLEVAVWLPLILLFLDIGVERIRDRESGASSPNPLMPIIWAGLALSVSILAGHPQTSLYVFYTSLAYLLFRLWRKTRPGSLSLRQRAARFLASVPPFSLFPLIGLGLAGVQILPTLEFIGLSTRTELSYKAVSWGLPLGELVTLVYPGFKGGSPLYVGILPMILMAVAVLFERRGRDKIFWVGLGIVSLLLSFGRNTFLFSPFYIFLPGFGMVRNQERVAFLFSFSAAVLAGYGALLMVRPLPQEVRRRFLTFYRWLGRIGWAALALTAPLYYGWVSANQAGVEVNLFDGALRHHVFALLLLAASLGLLTLRLTRGASRRWLMGLTVGIILLNLFTVNWRYNLKHMPPEYRFPMTGLVEFLGRTPAGQGQGRISSAGLLPSGASAGAVYKLEDIIGNSPLHLASFEEFGARMGEWRRWQLLNVTHVLDKRDLDSEGLRRVYEEDEIKVYEVTDPLPRVWVVHEAQVAGNDEETWAILNAPDFDLKKIAVLERQPDIPLPGGEVRGSSARFSRPHPTRLVVEVDMAANGLLILSEVYYPGWRARVDGRAAPLYRANYLLRGVPLETGGHEVEVYYDPPSFKVGLGITILTLLLSVIVAVIGTRR